MRYYSAFEPYTWLSYNRWDRKDRWNIRPAILAMLRVPWLWRSGDPSDPSNPSNRDRWDRQYSILTIPAIDDLQFQQSWRSEKSNQNYIEQFWQFERLRHVKNSKLLPFLEYFSKPKRFLLPSLTFTFSFSFQSYDGEKNQTVFLEL